MQIFSRKTKRSRKIEKLLDELSAASAGMNECDRFIKETPPNEGIVKAARAKRSRFSDRYESAGKEVEALIEEQDKELAKDKERLRARLFKVYGFSLWMAARSRKSLDSAIKHYKANPSLLRGCTCTRATIVNNFWTKWTRKLDEFMRDDGQIDNVIPYKRRKR